MTTYLTQFYKLILLTFMGTAASVIIGLTMYGGEVFEMSSIGFSFVSFGFSGSFIFAFYHIRGLSETITAAVVVSAIQFAVSTSWITVLNAGIWSFGVNLPLILVAFIFERKLAPFKHYKFAVVALLYGAMFVLLTLLVAWWTAGSLLPAAVYRENFVDGLLIGLGVAIGIEAGEALIHSIEHHSTPVQKHA